MDKKKLVNWLREVARHIEEETPLIRSVSVDDALSGEGLVRKIITITFNVPDLHPAENSKKHITRH